MDLIVESYQLDMSPMTLLSVLDDGVSRGRCSLIQRRSKDMTLGSILRISITPTRRTGAGMGTGEDKTVLLGIPDENQTTVTVQI